MHGSVPAQALDAASFDADFPFAPNYVTDAHTALGAKVTVLDIAAFRSTCMYAECWSKFRQVEARENGAGAKGGSRLSTTVVAMANENSLRFLTWSAELNETALTSNVHSALLCNWP